MKKILYRNYAAITAQEERIKTSLIPLQNVLEEFNRLGVGHLKDTADLQNLIRIGAEGFIRPIIERQLPEQQMILGVKVSKQKAIDLLLEMPDSRRVTDAISIAQGHEVYARFYKIEGSTLMLDRHAFGNMAESNTLFAVGTNQERLATAITTTLEAMNDLNSAMKKAGCVPLDPHTQLNQVFIVQHDGRVEMNAEWFRIHYTALTGNR